MIGPINEPQKRTGNTEKERTAYEPRLIRNRWTHAGTAIDQFFDRFVPMQYENGFAWRCQVIKKGEEARVKPFEEQPPETQRIIAGNAEVLLELYQETDPGELDAMRRIGGKIAGLETIDPDQEFEGDSPLLRDEMSRRHHEKWLSQFKADVAAGRRKDPDHRGAKEFDDLPPIERTIMKVQTWANWRILGKMSDEDYRLIRNISERQSGKYRFFT